MKLRIILPFVRGLTMGLAILGSMALAGTASAQNAPEQFVVSGKAAEQIQDFNTINLATAERIADVCEKAAADQGVQISIMVLDSAGNHVYMDRMDGQGYLNIITADMKARTALLNRGPSKDLMNRVIKDPTSELELTEIGYFANSGGLPIIVNKQIIGFVGVGGSAPHVPVWSDEICAHKALVDVIGPSVAPLSEDLPPAANPNPGKAPVPRFSSAAPPKSNLPAEYVVGGKGASNVFDGNQISLAAAKKICRACRDWAASKGSGVSIYVLDNAGEFVHMERMDGQSTVNMRAALLKAQTSLKTRQPTSIVGAQLKNNPGGLPRFFVKFDLFEVPGGVPIVVDGQMIGAAGAGGFPGGTENCVIEGLKAAFGERATLPVYPAAAQ
jgi:glc operon protein GlcG